MIRYLVDLRLGARAAGEAGIGETEEFARQLAYLREKMLLEEYMQREVDAAVTDEAARELYETTTTEVEPQEEVRAKAIFYVEEEEEAVAVLARLDERRELRGTLPAEFVPPRTPGSAPRGGDLGLFQHRTVWLLPSPEAAFALEPEVRFFRFRSGDPVRLARDQGGRPP